MLINMRKIATNCASSSCIYILVAANIQTAYDMGAHLFLAKPFLFNEVVGSIKAVLSLDWSDPGAIKQQHLVNGRFTAFKQQQ